MATKAATATWTIEMANGDRHTFGGVDVYNNAEGHLIVTGPDDEDGGWHLCATYAPGEWAWGARLGRQMVMDTVSDESPAMLIEPEPSAFAPPWDDAPDWAQWLAQDDGGSWYWYDEKPEPSHPHREWWWGPTQCLFARPGTPNPNWRETLQHRPEPPALELKPCPFCEWAAAAMNRRPGD